MKHFIFSSVLSILMSMTMTNAFAMSTGSDSDETPKPAVVVASAQGNTVTSSAFDTDKKWVNTYEYELTINPLNNPKVVVGGVARYVALDYFRFNWNGDDPAAQTIFSGRSAILPAGFLKDTWKTLTITPQNIENLVDDATYEFVLTGYEYDTKFTPAVRIARIHWHFRLTKVMPDEATTLVFRPKQEVEDGSGKVIAYMIPNKEYTTAFPYCPWTVPGDPRGFAYHQTKTEMEACYDASDDKATNGFKNLTNIFYNLSKNGQNGMNTGVYVEDEWDKSFEFVFGTSLREGDEDVALVDGDGKGVSYEHPVGYDTNQKYMLNVDASYIDGKTWHEVKTSALYRGVSTKLKANGSVECFKKDYRVDKGQTFQFQYACWHHANTFAWVDANKQAKLMWSHEALTRTSDFNDIASKNTYDPGFFGNGTASSVLLRGLVDKNFLDIANHTIELNTKADGSGLKNPYFVPSINTATNKIEYVQCNTQSDAAPVADHTEYLIVTMKDAFGHDVRIVLDVLVKTPSVTGIENIEAQSAGQNDSYYTLEGQRVDRPTKGVYIKSGKKVIMK
jgi:hypothetical protein